MSKLTTTITVGAVSALIGFAAMAEHEGGAGKQGFSPNTGAGFTGQEGGIDESRWIQQRAAREFAIAEQDCATLKYSSPNQFDPCMQQAEAARQNTVHSGGGESMAANQGGQGGGPDKGAGIMDKVTDKVTEVAKAVTETLGFSSEKTGQHGGSGQSSQGAFPQHGQMQSGQTQQWGYNSPGQGGQTQQWGYSPGQGGQTQQGGHMPQQGGQSAQHAYTPGHGGYMPGHGTLDPGLYEFSMANREHMIRHQECETIKRSDPQGYEQCLEQADAALKSDFSAEKSGSSAGNLQQGS